MSGICFADVYKRQGHGDDVAVNAILCLERSGVITECHQHLLKLVHCGGHRQTEEVQPLGIDEAHVCLLYTSHIGSHVVGTALPFPRRNARPTT